MKITLAVCEISTFYIARFRNRSETYEVKANKVIKSWILLNVIISS